MDDDQLLCQDVTVSNVGVGNVNDDDVTSQGYSIITTPEVLKQANRDNNHSIMTHGVSRQVHCNEVDVDDDNAFQQLLCQHVPCGDIGDGNVKNDNISNQD